LAQGDIDVYLALKAGLVAGRSEEGEGGTGLEDVTRSAVADAILGW
jgi:hypothetical protein